MNKEEQIQRTEEFVRENLKLYDSGHDWYHIDRVRRLAKFINSKEKLTDPFTLDIAVLLHDTADSKFNGGDSNSGYKIIEDFLISVGLDEIKDQVIMTIMNVSYSNKNAPKGLKDPLLQVLQDADRLDAIGAIGIARAFNYGGFRNNPIYVPADLSGKYASSTIGHFYDKLLKLKDLMNTTTGSRLAEERHYILEKFLADFYTEWEFGI